MFVKKINSDALDHIVDISIELYDGIAASHVMNVILEIGGESPMMCDDRYVTARLLKSKIELLDGVGIITIKPIQK